MRRLLACALIALAALATAPTAAGGATAAGPSVTFVGAGHSAAPSQKTKSVAVPSGTAAGDTLVLVFTHATSQAWDGPTGVTGWRQVASVTGANSLVSTVYVKQAVAADTSATVRFVSPVYSKAMATLASYRGADPSAVTAVGAAASTSSTQHPTPSATAPSGATVASYWVDKSIATTSWTAPSSVTTRDTALGTGSGRYNSLLADAGPVSAGSYGPVTAVTDGASRAVAWTVVLPPAGAGSTQPITKLMVVWEENHTSAVLSQMPYLSSLGQKYGQATQYSGVTHPSLGNYLVAASGQGASTCGLRDPLPSACPQSGPTVFRQALDSGATAKTYAESMTANCQRTNSTNYAARHNPWVYFTDDTTACQQYDVPLGTLSSGALRSDVDNGNLPNVSMVVPNLLDDAHNGTPQDADTWLSQWLPVVMAGPDFTSGKLAVVVTFDEGVSTNQVVPFVLVSQSVSQRVVSSVGDHYALCRLYSDVLHVAPLTGCAAAPSLQSAFGL